MLFVYHRQQFWSSTRQEARSEESTSKSERTFPDSLHPHCLDLPPFFLVLAWKTGECFPRATDAQPTDINGLANQCFFVLRPFAQQPADPTAARGQSKAMIMEIKALKSPPHGIILVGEAVACLLQAPRASWHDARQQGWWRRFLGRLMKRSLYREGFLRQKAWDRLDKAERRSWFMGQSLYSDSPMDRNGFLLVVIFFSFYLGVYITYIYIYILNI